MFENVYRALRPFFKRLASPQWAVEKCARGCSTRLRVLGSDALLTYASACRPLPWSPRAAAPPRPPPPFSWRQLSFFSLPALVAVAAQPFSVLRGVRVVPVHKAHCGKVKNPRFSKNLFDSLALSKFDEGGSREGVSSVAGRLSTTAATPVRRPPQPANPLVRGGRSRLVRRRRTDSEGVAAP